tara:strand:- start:1387 stop:2433 length:1047 start_codon:yes stop_codon:yes gene_type:complete
MLFTSNFSKTLRIFFSATLLFVSCTEFQTNIEPDLNRIKRPEAGSQSKLFSPDGFYETIPKMPPKGYVVKKLADDVYFFSTGLYNNLFVVGAEGVLITDPIEGAGPLLKKAVAEITDLPIRFMVYTHSHIDHIGDAYLFSEKAQIIGHKATLKQLKRYKDPHRPPPHIAFDKKYTLSFGGPKIDLIFVSEGHDMGNVMVHIPERKVLMIVDVATPKAVPFKNFSTVDLYGQILGIQRALSLDWNIYVAGHLYRPGKRPEMKEVLDYYYAAKSANAKAMQRVRFRDVIEKTQSKDIERIFGEYYDAVGEECYRILKKNWKQKLMGFEAFSRGHCDAWTAFHRTHKRPSR